MKEIFRNLALNLLRVTEAAAMAAGRWVGRRNKDGADAAAVQAKTIDSGVGLLLRIGGTPEGVITACVTPTTRPTSLISSLEKSPGHAGIRTSFSSGLRRRRVASPRWPDAEEF
jgi:hypothetical protein